MRPDEPMRMKEPATLEASGTPVPKRMTSRLATRLGGLALAGLLPVEIASLLAMRGVLDRLGPGDGHPVIVLPGFGASDGSTRALRWALERQGFSAYPWGMGANVGPTAEVVAGMRSLLDELHRSHGRTVSLIGWSLGGILARNLARESPSKVRLVITLGSPYRMLDSDHVRGMHAAIPQAIFRRLRAEHDPAFEIMRIPEHERTPLRVPATSIYSRTDSLAAWRLSIDATGPDAPNPRAENIEVLTSHIGLAFNLSVLAAVIDRLSMPENDWQPFQPRQRLQCLYPRPANWCQGLTTSNG